MSGKYFDLACALVGVSQEEVARRMGRSASTLSRAFSGQLRINRETVLQLGDILLEVCPPEERDLLLALEEHMLHTLGYATRADEQRGAEQLSDYERQVNAILAQRQQRSSS